MIKFAGGLLGGILIALASPPAWQGAVLATSAMLAALGAVAGRPALALAFACGVLLAQHEARRVLDAAHDCGERRLVVARIVSIPVAQDAGWRYDAVVEPASPPRHAPLRVRVSHPSGSAPRSGEHWQLLLQFDQPASGRAADAARRALLRDHVSATARARPSPLNRRLSPAGASIDGLRLRVAERIQARVADPSAAALLAALAVGVTGDVSDLQWRVFSATGITHLVAISGMHVTFFAVLCMALARRLWRRWGGLAARCRRESFAALVGVLMAFAYALLSGFSVPAQRTALMLAVFLAAQSCGRQVSPLWSVAAALLVVLAMDPMAVLGAGFWLSFGAVVAIIGVAGGRLQAPGSLRAALLVQWVVTVALLPVTAALFGTFSAIGPLVNAAAIPLFTIALVPPTLVATALYLLPLEASRWCADQLVGGAAWVAQQAWPPLVRAADLPAAAWAADASVPWLLLATPAVLALLGPWPAGLRLGAAALLCSALPVRASRPETGALEVVVFDVGAARAVLLRTRGHQLLYGSGERFGTSGRRFERVVLPELRRLPGPVVMILDRADRDSLRALAVARARVGLSRGIVASGRAPPELRPCADERWHWDGVTFALHAAPSGCWLEARAAGRVLVAPVRTPTSMPPPRAAAATQDGRELIVLPRRASDAAWLAGQAGTGSLLVASASAAEMQSTGWRQLRQQRDGGAAPLWSTATAGDIRLSIGADGRAAREDAGGWRPGIWIATGDSAACRAAARNADEGRAAFGL